MDGIGFLQGSGQLVSGQPLRFEGRWNPLRG